METSQQDTTDWTSVLFDLRRSVCNLVLYVLESMPLPWLLTPSAAAAAAASPSPVLAASPVMASQPQQQPQQPQQPPLESYDEGDSYSSTLEDWFGSAQPLPTTLLPPQPQPLFPAAAATRRMKHQHQQQQQQPQPVFSNHSGPPAHLAPTPPNNNNKRVGKKKTPSAAAAAGTALDALVHETLV